MHNPKLPNIQMVLLPTVHGWLRPLRIDVFIAGILRWLKMNCLPGEASTDMQVDYPGTHLTGKAQE